jgi:hypothetical protein
LEGFGVVGILVVCWLVDFEGMAGKTLGAGGKVQNFCDDENIRSRGLYRGFMSLILGNLGFILKAIDKR